MAHGNAAKDNLDDRQTAGSGDCGSGRYRCFCASTLIDTPAGPRPVEALQPGDLVCTLDHGAQPVAWIWSGKQPLHGVERAARPIVIRAGALGQGRPWRDLILSPQHGVLVGEAMQYHHRAARPALADARALTSEPGVRPMMGRRAAHWFNFACERHEIVCANGVYTESLLIGTATIASMTRRERDQLGRAFPRPKGVYLNGPPARPAEVSRPAAA